jgi:hypothetical protein
MGENGREGAAGAETSDIGAIEAPGRERRMTATGSGTLCCGSCGASRWKLLYGISR